MKKLIYGLSFAALLISCQEKEQNELTPNNASQLREAASEFTVDDVEVQEGVLKFQDKLHLRDVARQIKDGEKSSTFEGKSGFKSLLARQNAVTEEDVHTIAVTRQLGEFSDLLVFRGKGDDVSLDPIVGDKRYAALFNEKSIVIVGDSAYRIGFADQSAIEIASHPERLRKFKENPDMAETTHTRIVRERTTMPNARTSAINSGDVITPKYKDGGKWFRFYAQFDRNLAGVYKSLAVKVRHQRRDVWIWSLYGTNRVGFSGSGYYYEFQNIPFYTFPWSGSQVNYGVSEANIFVDETYGSVALDWVSGSATMDCQGRNGSGYYDTFTP